MTESKGIGKETDRLNNEQDIEQIRTIIETAGRRYVAKGGGLQFAGIENGTTVKIMPAGFCWQ